MKSDPTQASWLDCSSSPFRIKGQPLTNLAIKEHSGMFYCLHSITYNKREYLAPGDEVESVGCWFFFKEEEARSAADWLTENEPADPYAISVDITVYRMRIEPKHWNAIPDDHPHRKRLFDPVPKYRGASPIKDEIESHNLQHPPAPQQCHRAVLTPTPPTLHDLILTWAAAQGVPLTEQDASGPTGPLWLLEGGYLRGEMRVQQVRADPPSYYLTTMNGNMILDESWADSKSLPACLTMALRMLQKRVKTDAPQWHLHLGKLPE